MYNYYTPYFLTVYSYHDNNTAKHRYIHVYSTMYWYTYAHWHVCRHTITMTTIQRNIGTYKVLWNDILMHTHMYVLVWLPWQQCNNKGIYTCSTIMNYTLIHSQTLYVHHIIRKERKKERKTPEAMEKWKMKNESCLRWDARHSFYHVYMQLPWQQDNKIYTYSTTINNVL